MACVKCGNQTKESLVDKEKFHDDDFDVWFYMCREAKCSKLNQVHLMKRCSKTGGNLSDDDVEELNDLLGSMGGNIKKKEKSSSKGDSD